MMLAMEKSVSKCQTSASTKCLLLLNNFSVVVEAYFLGPIEIIGPRTITFF